MTPLRHRMLEDMQIRNLAPHTQRAYAQQISLFARYFGKSPALLGPAEIGAYQLHLIQERHLSASSILVAVAAIRFLYKVTLKREWSIEETVPTCRKPQRLPVVLSRNEVSRFLDAVQIPKYRVILTVCYAAGLRISEAVRLTPTWVKKVTASVGAFWYGAAWLICSEVGGGVTQFAG
ncbi:MAG: phage integrase N-terminal SAM-like domain-containing protein [Acetobacteraceae bacterium]|nr:phage integrase N-terminal SAM-like domain-containing protein [Acetobacteraceae bacterium]